MKKEGYYGLKYGSFEWVRGTIDIHDLDDVRYAEVCLRKIRKRLREKRSAK